jgi:uncharacterized protein YecE (DUF72 family)
MGEIRVGTSSWTDRSLLESGWYPDGVITAEQRLAYYARQFSLVEVDSTYYTPPSERNAELWVRRTPAGFTFDVKAFSLLTQHPTRVASLYRDLRPVTDKRTVYLKDLDPGVVEEVWMRFLAALDPLGAAGKLGAVLFQFPPWFPSASRTREYILECKERCAPARICVEFRNATWLSERNVERTVDFLRSHAVPYVCVDMPQGYPSSVPPVVVATAELAVVRFHGHSSNWTSHDIQQRFGYLYSEDELRQWVPRVRALAEDAASVHVLMNNCCSDNAQVNAGQLTALLSGSGSRRTAQAPRR